jgi:CelD/BcsL family acetyltransferase involved in cellulose biosynthesis
MSTLALELVTDPEALAPEWRALFARCPDATPFQSPEWQLPWWRQWGTGEARIAVLRDDESLLGLLPLYVLRDGNGSRLLPIGAGISDYLDALIAPAAPADAAERLLGLALSGSDVAHCDLPELPPHSPLRMAAAPPGWRSELVDGETCPVLPPDEEAVPARMRRKLRMSRHRADRGGAWEARDCAGDEIPAALDALMRFNDGRWGGAGVFADARVRDFHREAAPLLRARSLLRLMVLRVGGEIAAVVYALRAADGTMFLHLGGFDPDRSFISPGTLLIGAVVEQCAGELHFLRGDEAYKYAWGARDRRNAMRRLWR